MTRYNHTGFTLVETMIVLMIISLITSVVLPNYSKIQKHAKLNTLKNIGYSLQLSLESYYLESNSYPETSLTIDELETLLENNNIRNTKSTNPFTGQYFDSSDPSGKIEYTYDTSESQYTLTLYGYLNEAILLNLTN